VTDHPRVRNLSVLIVLSALFMIPSFFISRDHMLDIVSVLMLVFGIAALALISGEVWEAFWEGNRDRVAVGLYGLFALLLSVIVMRSYGILTRNVDAAKWLQETNTYAAMVYLQFVGLWLFFRASTPPTVPAKRSRWGQLVLGIFLGILLASSKALEPILMWVGKMLGRMF
jgi:hypothetical protein